MDKETLRKQIYDELHSQFEGKLRDAKKHKTQVEEELEAASEKWRAERRRLNAEIDRLENALADTRDSRRKTGDAKPGKASESPDLTKIQAAADEKLKKAGQDWQNERSKLEAEITRLQQGVAELLERANNPLRAGQAAREVLEGKLEEALRMKRQAEDTLIAAKADWDQEKLKMVGDMVKLRRSTGKTTKGIADEDRILELEKQLQDAFQSRAQLNANLEKAAAEASKAREAYAAEIKRLSEQLEESRIDGQRLSTRLDQSSGESQKQLQEAVAARAGLERDLVKARQEITQLRETHTSELRRNAGQIDDTQGRIEQLQKQLTQAGADRERLASDLEQARRQLTQLKDETAETIRRSAADLGDAQLKIQQLERRVEDTRGSVSKGQAEHLQKQLDQTLVVRENLERDLQKTRQRVTELEGAKAKVEQLQKELTAATASRDELEQKLGTTQKEAAHLIDAQSTSLRRATAQLEESQKRIQELEQRIDQTKGSVSKEQGELQKQLTEALATRETLNKDLQAAREESTQAKESQTSNLRRMMNELGDARTTIQHLERRLEENKNAVNGEVVEQLRRQYDERMQEMIQQKTQLSEELKKASSLLETERSRFSAASAASAQSQSKQESTKKDKGAKGGGSTVDTETLNSEVARIEEMIKGLARLIDDPSTELSTVIRKNVERAELDAYLKGILFSVGRSRGL